MEKSFKNLSIEEQGNRLRKWIESHLTDKSDIACFDGFIRKVAYNNYKKGYNEGYYEGQENAKRDLELEREIEEELNMEIIEFEG